MRSAESAFIPLKTKCFELATCPQGLTQPYGFFPLALNFTSADFTDVSVTPNMRLLSPDTDDTNVDHWAWHGVFQWPVDYGGIFTVRAAACERNCVSLPCF
jgi:hypothetical protein